MPERGWAHDEIGWAESRTLGKRIPLPGGARRLAGAVSASIAICNLYGVEADWISMTPLDFRPARRFPRQDRPLPSRSAAGKERMGVPQRTCQVLWNRFRCSV